MADEFTPNQPNTNQKKQSRNVQNDAFGDVVDFANLHSFDGTAFDEQFQNLASFGENLQTGQQSLIDQTVQGAVNVKKAVGEADARSEGADRFTQKDETGAVKSTIDQFGKSFAANRESLREASDRYFETAGTLLQQDTVLEELGQNI